LGKAVVIASSGGSSVTTIAPPGASSCARFVTGESAATVLSGFTLSGCLQHGVRTSASSPILRDLVVTGNGSNLSLGGGLLVEGGSPTLERVVLTGNLALDGGGLAIRAGGSVVAERMTVTGNDAARRGGGVHVDAGTLLWLGGTLSSNDSILDGGGGYAHFSTVDLRGVDVLSNAAVGPAPTLSTNYGGGWFVAGGTFTATHGLWSANDARAGGALASDKTIDPMGYPVPATVALAWLRIDGNTALFAEAVKSWSTDLSIDDCEIVDHAAPTNLNSVVHLHSGTSFVGRPSYDQYTNTEISRTRFRGNGHIVKGNWGWESQDVFIDCDFTDNTQVAVPMWGFRFERGTFRENTGSALIDCAGCGPTLIPKSDNLISGVVFVDNVSTGVGAVSLAINPGTTYTTVLSNNLFVGNFASWTAAVQLGTGNFDVFSNTFVGNQGLGPATSSPTTSAPSPCRGLGATRAGRATSTTETPSPRTPAGVPQAAATRPCSPASSCTPPTSPASTTTSACPRPRRWWTHGPAEASMPTVRSRTPAHTAGSTR
jgi:hypothetical protein